LLLLLLRTRRALGEMARKSNPGDAFRTKKISQMSAYLSRREVTPDLVRRIRVYFQSHYETGSVFAQKEYEDYFMRLPAEHRNELAAEVGYLVRAAPCSSEIGLNVLLGLLTWSWIACLTKKQRQTVCVAARQRKRHRATLGKYLASQS
jgi:hypothetical protein